MDDNFKKTDIEKQIGGPFFVKDNYHSDTLKPKVPKTFVKLSSSSVGPFTRADNSETTNTKLIDYIKEINAKELERDYYNKRKFRSYDQQQDSSQQFQRRMLYYPGKYQSMLFE